MMQYEEAVSYIHSLLAFGIQPGLTRIEALLEALGNPHKTLKFIHVAGTNGKGSTSTMLSQILKAAGKKTGLFTSPYVYSFCERMQINNENISETELAAIVERVKAAIEQIKEQGIQPTEFEAITAAAMLWFKEKNCDVVVLETGLGGRLDSTNVIDTPLVTVITSISLDHTAILGDTIEQIAAEKAGIIKEHAAVVTTNRQEEAALQVLQNKTEEMHGHLLVANTEKAEILERSLQKTVFTYEGETYEMRLAGDYQIENAVGVIEAAKTLSFVNAEQIKTGIQNTVMRARCEYKQGENGAPDLLLDGGHNPECATALADLLNRFAPKHVTAVIGMMHDKDMKAYLHTVLPYCDKVYFTKPKNPRAAETKDLAEAAKGIENLSVFEEPHPQTAYEKAKANTEENGLVLLCGSFYMLSEIETL